MKQILLFISIAFFACLVSGLSSCNTACSGVNCQNSGQCNGGSCSCPSGYSGNLCQLSSIVFVNNSFTEAFVIVNGIGKTVPPNGITVAFSDTAGKPAVVSAYTYGLLATGLADGDTVKWPGNYNYPTTATQDSALMEPLNVPSTYFYLKIVNNDASQTVDSIVVNYGGTNGAMSASVSVPANNTPYGIGYYNAYSTTSVTAYGSSGGVWTYSPSQLALADTANQAATITIP